MAYFYVYELVSVADPSCHYTGFTEDLEGWLPHHNSGGGFVRSAATNEACPGVVPRPCGTKLARFRRVGLFGRRSELRPGTP